MTDWTPQDDWSQVKVGDPVRAMRAQQMLTGKVVDRYVLSDGAVASLFVEITEVGEQIELDHDYWQLSVPAKPAVVLPDEPGIYVSHNEPPSPVIIHKIVDGRWVDADDENYLTEAGVIALMPLTKLEPVAVTAKNVIEFIDTYPFSDALDAARKEFGVTE
jgi:hypothetical protein